MSVKRVETKQTVVRDPHRKRGTEREARSHLITVCVNRVAEEGLS